MVFLASTVNEPCDVTIHSYDILPPVMPKETQNAKHKQTGVFSNIFCSKRAFTIQVTTNGAH